MNKSNKVEMYIDPELISRIRTYPNEGLFLLRAFGLMQAHFIIKNLKQELGQTEFQKEEQNITNA